MRISATIFVGLAVVVLAACAARPPHEFDRQADFTQLRTFQWLEPTYGDEGVAISHPVLDSPLLGRRVRQATSAALEARGYREVESDPDFFVTYHTAQSQQERRHGSYMQLGYGQFRPRFGSAVVVDMWPRTFNEGTLIIDIVDAGSGDLVWRGWRDTELTRRSFDEARVNDAVNYILSAFPPGR
jgi:hypothetical protein